MTDSTSYTDGYNTALQVYKIFPVNDFFFLVWIWKINFDPSLPHIFTSAISQRKKFKILPTTNPI